MKRSIPIRVVGFLLLFALIFARLTAIYQPKRVGTAWDYTTKMDGFLNLEEDTVDIMGFGSSHMYCSLVPSCVEEETGKTAYILATQQQPIQATYYYIREALKTQSPSVIFLETYMVRKSSDYEDAVLYDAFDPMPLSLNKLQMVWTLTRDRGDGCVPFFCTLLKYHTRWNELEDIDYDYDSKTANDPNNGYVYLTDAHEQEASAAVQTGEVAQIDPEALEYLDKIVQLTREQDIRLVLLYAPYPVRQKDVAHINAIAQYAEENDLEFLNGWEQFDTFGFDLSTDFYDGEHLNLSGATKYTEYLCDYLNS